MNYRLIATLVGDHLKYSVTVNEVDRAGRSLFTFARESFPNDSITSVRAQLIYDWILTLAKQEMTSDERNRLLVRFCLAITPDGLRDEIERILRDNSATPASEETNDWREFTARAPHPEVVRHARALFVQGNYFHAVFEAAKAYNKAVKEKAQSDRDGEALMLAVWGCEGGVLKVTACQSETDRNVQDGIKFLSAGLMRAIRNPTSHEPAVDWPISKQDCMDVLSFLSFLNRQLDRAIYVPRS